VLELLEARGPLSPSELAAATGLTNAALTAVMDRLEQAGLVARRQDPTDRRRLLVDLTASARRAAGETFAGLFRRLDELLGRYSDAELATIVEFLTGARAALLGHAGELRSGKVKDGSGGPG
jgi:DNA-binding MarR family transcriptional regulator